MNRTAKSKRAPRAFAPDDPKIIVREADRPEAELDELAPPDHKPPASPSGSITRGFKWGGILLAALGALATLSVSIWFTSLSPFGERYNDCAISSRHCAISGSNRKNT